MKITSSLSDYFLPLKNINEDVHEFESCQEIGCSKMELEYKASDEQLKSLVEISTECEQSISIDCVNSPLKVLDVEKAWWTDLNGKLRQIYLCWGRSQTMLTRFCPLLTTYLHTL